MYDGVLPKLSEVVTQCVTLVTLLSHWLQLCEEQSHVTGDGRALAPKRQKPQKNKQKIKRGEPQVGHKIRLTPPRGVSWIASQTAGEPTSADGNAKIKQISYN